MIPDRTLVLVAGSFDMLLGRKGRSPYACWVEGLVRKFGTDFEVVSADMAQKVDSLGQRWFKKIMRRPVYARGACRREMDL